MMISSGVDSSGSLISLDGFGHKVKNHEPVKASQGRVKGGVAVNQLSVAQRDGGKENKICRFLSLSLSERSRWQQRVFSLTHSIGESRQVHFTGKLDEAQQRDGRRFPCVPIAVDVVSLDVEATSASPTPLVDCSTPKITLVHRSLYNQQPYTYNHCRRLEEMTKNDSLLSKSVRDAEPSE